MSASPKIAGWFHSSTEPRQPPALPGFEHINRYWDRERGCHAAKILPGEYYVTIRDEAVVTVLGSCISACIRDCMTGIGGMNHFMLPDTTQKFDCRGVSAATRYGSYAMERMVNDILRNGGRRENLEVKVFGGGRILPQMTDIGMRNARFVEEYIREEELQLVALDVGDVYPRKVVYMPASGRVYVKKLRSLHNNTIIERETSYIGSLRRSLPALGAVDLF
jgi:chemotaxis protein CheD